jgi:hypothetical protein
MHFRIGDEIEFVDADGVAYVRRARVTRFLTDEQLGMRVEGEITAHL